jgi:hypothetical protein
MACAAYSDSARGGKRVGYPEMCKLRQQRGSKPHLWLIQFIGVIVPRRMRADWRQEWEAELRHRETLLAAWDKLDWRNKLDLLRRSLGAFRDALLLQPRRLEDEMFQDLRFGVRMLVKRKGFTFVAVLSFCEPNRGEMLTVWKAGKSGRERPSLL